jgi:hypothetical protein
MVRHTIQIVAITVLALLCIFYPFFPGPHDRLAVTLSMMAQMLGFAGLLLVPVGVFWLIFELTKRGSQQDSVSRTDRGYFFALAALAGFFVVAVGVALAALIHTGPSLGLVVLIAWACILRRIMPALERLKNPELGRFNPTPLYLIFVPCILVIAQLLFFRTAVEFSRRHAIHGSADFISAIEAYRTAHGSYPLSLASVHHDYDPFVVGVERYHYEPNGNTYNVFFEQVTYPIGMQEFVMYNPLDKQVMIVHNQDLLESSQEQVDRERTFHARAARDAGVRHWKYFWFD